MTLNFAGFPRDAIDFYTEIRFNNNKPWFAENKKRFQRSVQRPAQAFVEALGERLSGLLPINYNTKLNGSGSIMRIYRDMRFSPDKTPYKTNLGIIFWAGYGKKTAQPGFYFQLDADGGLMHAGLYQFEREMLQRYRELVDEEKSGTALEAAMAEMEQRGYPVFGKEYKRVPRGYAKEHPRAELLKHKGLYTHARPLTTAELTSPELVDICFDQCVDMLPLFTWLTDQLTISNE